MSTFSGIRTISLAAIAAASLFAGSTPGTAAGLKSMKPAATHPVSWTGFYVGAHGGYAWVDTSGIFDNGDGVSLPTDYSTFDLDSGVFGLQTGYRHQLGRFVVGVEGDFSTGNLDDGETADGDVPPDERTAKLEHLASVRAVLGAKHNRFLFFGTVGLGHAQYEVAAVDFSRTPPVGSLTREETGVAYGGGAEWAGNNDRVSFRVEYLHYDVGRTINIADEELPDADTGDFITYDDIDVVRVGVNIRFGGRDRVSDKPFK